MQVLTVKDINYNLKFTTQSFISLENRLKKNPLNVFIEITDNNIPKLSDLMIMLHEALLPLNHGIKLEEVYQIFDSYCENGGNIISLIEVLVKTLQDSGFIPSEQEVKN